MFLHILLYSLLAGLATLLGSFFVVAFGKPGEKLLSIMLGMACGIMMAVVIFDLIPSALNQGNILTTIIGFFLGILLLLILDFVMTALFKLNSTYVTDRKGHLLKMGYLIAIGIALHDLPEGIAIAVGYSATEQLGLLIALSIGLHNIPEGMATAAPLQMGGVSPWKILLLSFFVSMFTPLGSAIGLVIMSITKEFICLLLSLAGGAMTYIVGDELLPESRQRHPNWSTLGIVMGIGMIMFLGLLH